MAEADLTRWYCWDCDLAWGRSETGTKHCPDCGGHGVRRADIG